MPQYKLETNVKNRTTFRLSDSVSKAKYNQNCNISDLASYIVSNNSIICQMARNSALIDWAAPDRKVYQVTVSADHSLNKSGLAELFLACGLLVRNEYKKITKSTNLELKAKIEYYWVIPDTKKNMWIGKSPKTIEANNKIKRHFTTAELKCLKYVLGNCVTQYVLIMQPKT
jgi:hypothetical protein